MEIQNWHSRSCDCDYASFCVDWESLRGMPIPGELFVWGQRFFIGLYSKVT